MRSKAHWGHNQEFLEAVRPVLTFTEAAELGFDRLVIEADPNAEPFYLAMGAMLIGDRRSPSGRTLPLLLVNTR